MQLLTDVTLLISFQLKDAVYACILIATTEEAGNGNWFWKYSICFKC